MVNRNTAGNRFVETVNGVVRPVEPHPIRITETKPEDYPDLPKVYFEVADMWGSRFGGPPLCDEWVAVLKHILTEEEAGAIRHMKGARKGKTAQDIADAEHRPVEDMRRIMDILTYRSSFQVRSLRERFSVWSVIAELQ